MNAVFVLTVLGMGLVTYLPRLLPLTLADRLRLPEPLLLFLRNIPYAMLGALIFPGVLDSAPDAWMGGTAAFVAVLLAWLGVPLLGVLFGSIGTLYLLLILA